MDDDVDDVHVHLGVHGEGSKTESIGRSGKNGGKGGVIAMTSYDVRCSRAFASVRRSAVHQTIGGKSANHKSEIKSVGIGPGSNLHSEPDSGESRAWP